LHRERVEFNKSERARKKAKKEADLVHKRHERELKKAIITTTNKPKPVRSMLQKRLQALQEPGVGGTADNCSTEPAITITRSGRNAGKPPTHLIK
jgi:hypothetical protein